MKTKCSKVALGVMLSVAVTATVVQSQVLETQQSTDTLFFDDFSGADLDRSKWNVIVTGFTVNNEQQAYVDSSATLYTVNGKDAQGAGKGALVLKALYQPGFKTPEGKSFDFISGRINSKNKVMFTYGTAAARMKLPAGSGLWPAFWALGDGKWPDIGEIDIMEFVGEPDWTSVALHGPGYSGETPLVNKVYFPEGHDATDWHIYSVDWTPEGFNFRVDGILIYRATRPMVEHYGRWAFDGAKFLILNLALGGAYPVKINGVEEPYHGLPESTVQLIKDEQAEVLVDWVLITK